MWQFFSLQYYKVFIYFFIEGVNFLQPMMAPDYWEALE